MFRYFALIAALAAGLWADDNTALYKAIENNAKLNVDRDATVPGVTISYEKVYTARFAEFASLLLYASKMATPLSNFANGALTAAFSARNDTQTEAPAASTSSTSLVTKGLAPKILSWAVEHGALQQEVDKTDVTFRGNVSGIVRALTKEGVIDVLYPDKTWWNGVSFAVTFDTNRGDQMGTLLANRQQIASWAVRSEVLNRRDPTAAEYSKEWKLLGADVAPKLIGSSATLVSALGGWDALATNPACDVGPDLKPAGGVYCAFLAALQKADQDYASSKDLAALHKKAADIADQYLPKIAALQIPADNAALNKSLDDYYSVLSNAIAQREKLKEFISRGLLVTADWTVTRDPNLPDLSTITGVVEFSPDKQRLHELTLNWSASFFNSLPKTATYKQWRDTKVALQYDVPLKIGLGANFVASLAGRWEHIPNAVPLDTADAQALAGSASSATTPMGMTMPMTPAMPMIAPGEVGLFQAKVTIPLGKTGLRLPLSLTTSNRKNLIQEKWSLGANFGLTIDFDSLFPSMKK